MKKKGGKKKGFNKLIAITIVAFFVFAFVLAFVNTPAPVTGEIVEGIGDGSGDFLQKWMDGSLDPTVMKYVFFIILTLLIWSILSSASWPDNAAVRWLIAIPVAFIGIAFLTPGQLYAALTTYGALALTLIVALPLVIMFFFSSQLLGAGRLTVGKVMFQLLLWYFYLAFLIYLLISAIGREGMVFSGTVIIIIAGGVVASLVIVFNRKFRKWVKRIGREITREVTEDIDTVAHSGEELIRRHHERNARRRRRERYD